MTTYPELRTCAVRYHYSNGNHYAANHRAIFNDKESAKQWVDKKRKYTRGFVFDYYES